MWSSKSGRALFLGAALVGSLVGCGKGDKSLSARVMDAPTIRTTAEAADYLKKAELISTAPLEKADRGDVLTDNDKDNLREAANIFDGLIAFSPAQYANYFGAGKMRFALNEYERSFNLMQQAITLAPPPNTKPSQDVIEMVAEAHYVSSECLVAMQRFAEAAEAARLACQWIPTSANYVAAQASAELQLKDEDKARMLVIKALGIDPKNKRALQLAKLLEVKMPKLN